MKYKIIPVTAFDQNCSLIWCETTQEAAVVDPGGDIDRILQQIEKAQVQVVKILLTHAHIDHAGATAELAGKLDVPIEGPHEGDRFWIDALPDQSRSFGFPPSQAFEPTRWLQQGDKVRFGDVQLDVLHCPGHTPGHVVFFCEAERLAIVGDVLFNGSIGRTDFPGGNFQELLQSIRQRLFPLGDDVAFIPGHGPMSTFGRERRHNPFVSDAAVS